MCNGECQDKEKPDHGPTCCLQARLFLVRSTVTKDTDGKTLQARFYLTESGANPVRDEIMKLPPEERKTVREDVKSV